jgi:hypothetical protein
MYNAQRATHHNQHTPQNLETGVLGAKPPPEHWHGAAQLLQQR